MSALAGVLHRDGRPGASLSLDRMVEALRPLGPEGQSTWEAGSVALGHCALDTLDTGGDGRSLMPLRSDIDDVVLTADARLDNRGELMRLLGISGADPVAEPALLLAAYRRWGKGFFRRLIGDFSVAIWDGRRRVLLCARDHTGIRQLYYHCGTGGAFQFSSALRGLLALPELPKRLDERRLADFIALGFGDHERTFYRDVKRLPPAHLLEVSADGVRLERYWAFDPECELRLGSDEAYCEAFRELFMQAVGARLRSRVPVGATLSGGLDSSCVAIAAQQLQGASLPTFSLMYPHLPQCDESFFIEAVLRRGGFDPHSISAEGLSPFADWASVTRAHEEPPWGPNVYLPWAFYREAARVGVRVLLTGFDGDSAVSHGFLRLADLAASGSLGQLLTEAAFLCWRTRRSPWSVMRRYVLGPLAPPLAKVAWHRLRGRPTATGSRVDLLRPEFRQRVGLDAPRPEASALGKGSRSRERVAHFERLISPLRDRVFELTGRSAAAFGVEPRHPFEDRRLLEFCLALPAEQKLRRGWPRSIVRRGVGDLLPVEVRQRLSKADFSHQFAHGMRRFESGRLEQLMGRPLEVLEPYADVKRLRELHRQCMVDPGSMSGVALFRVASLTMWLHSASISLN